MTGVPTTEMSQHAHTPLATSGGEGRKRGLCKKIAKGALWALQAAAAVAAVVKVCMAEGMCVQ
jgi:hypothetical protein